MRHKKAGVHLSRTPAHRKALFSNLVAALFNYEQIRTTDVKAKETRRLAERTITWVRRLGSVLTKKSEKRSPDERARVVHAARMARRVVRDRFAISKLFDEIGPRYLSRPGGYTRIVKIGQRPGDAAPMSILELIPGGAQSTAPGKVSQEGKASPSPGKGKEDAGAAKGVGGEGKVTKDLGKTAGGGGAGGQSGKGRTRAKTKDPLAGKTGGKSGGKSGG